MHALFVKVMSSSTWCAKRTFWTAGSCLQGEKYKNDRKNDTIIDWKEKTHCEHRSRPVVWVPNITEEVALISRTIRPHFSFTLISLIYKWWGSVAFFCIGPFKPGLLVCTGLARLKVEPWVTRRVMVKSRIFFIFGLLSLNDISWAPR